MSMPVRIHQENRKIFEFRGKPTILICATEHYGAVMNRPFNYKKYLCDAVDKKQTLTRLFVLFRELQNHCNPYSTCKPESPDYIAPYPRVGPGLALDGQLKYDLDQRNPEFFERLHSFLSLASEYGIIVELTLLSNTYNQEIWVLNPLNSKNNVNDVEETEWMDYISLRNPNFFLRQIAHVCKIVEETNKYDNVIFEICNEPGGSFQGTRSNPDPSEVNEWQIKIAKAIKDTESQLPNKHLIVGQEAFTYEPWQQTSDISFKSFEVDVVNIHPLPNTTFGGKSYDMGVFMSKQLRLEQFREYCLATVNESKPLNMDEDNAASQYKDYDGWTIHRKRAWTALLCGCHYDFIDFSIINYCETGTRDSQKHIRSWMKYLSEFIHSIDLVRARPLQNWLKIQPDYTVASVLAIEGNDYCIYLADGRELEEQGCGSLISGNVAMDLPAGVYKVSCFSPVTGVYSPFIAIEGGQAVSLEIPEFKHDIIVRIIRK